MERVGADPTECCGCERPPADCIVMSAASAAAAARHMLSWPRCIEPFVACAWCAGPADAQADGPPDAQGGKRDAAEDPEGRPDHHQAGESQLHAVRRTHPASPHVRNLGARALVWGDGAAAACHHGSASPQPSPAARHHQRSPAAPLLPRPTHRAAHWRGTPHPTHRAAAAAPAGRRGRPLLRRRARQPVRLQGRRRTRARGGAGACVCVRMCVRPACGFWLLPATPGLLPPALLPHASMFVLACACAGRRAAQGACGRHVRAGLVLWGACAAAEHAARGHGAVWGACAHLT